MEAKNITEQFDEAYKPGDSFFLFDEFPALQSNYQVETVVQCVQMVCEKPIPQKITEDLIPLERKHWDEMYELVSTVFPGY